MNKFFRHVRSNAVAYVALFVALGGTGYAALRIPANSVGNRQIKNGAITPVKLDRQLVSGSVRAWAEVSASGRLLAGEGSPAPVARTGADSLGQYLITWKTAAFTKCAATAGIASPRFSALTPGFAVAQLESGAGVQVDVYNAQSLPAAMPFWVALLC
jgi:hypothetical protein